MGFGSEVGNLDLSFYFHLRCFRIGLNWTFSCKENTNSKNLFASYCGVSSICWLGDVYIWFWVELEHSKFLFGWEYANHIIKITSLHCSCQLLILSRRCCTNLDSIFVYFFRGNGASVARIVPYAALHYMAYEEYRRWIILAYPDVWKGPVLDLLAGSFAGGTAVLFTYPLDLVRTKLAYQVSTLENS